MNILDTLQKANPHIHIYSVHDDEFKRYGSVIQMDTAALCAAAETVTFPDVGCEYAAVLPILDEHPDAQLFKELYCGGLDEEFGLCWGRNDTMNGLEWHTCNEFNIAVREMVLLLAKRSDLDMNGRLDAEKVKAFFVPQGDTVEMYADTLHYCPCEVTSKGFLSIVGLQRGTNWDLNENIKKSPGLCAANKWLLAHEEKKDLIDQGAIGAIYGENWKINPV